MLEIIVLSSKAFSSFIHQTLDLSWYLGHSPVFPAASSMFAIRGQSVAFQVLKLGTHENTHESGADAGRLKGVLRDAPDRQESRGAFCPCCWNARGIHRLLCENVKPLSLPAPATGVDRPGGQRGALLDSTHLNSASPPPQGPGIRRRKETAAVQCLILWI